MSRIWILDYKGNKKQRGDHQWDHLFSSGEQRESTWWTDQPCHWNVSQQQPENGPNEWSCHEIVFTQSMSISKMHFPLILRVGGILSLVFMKYNKAN